MCHGFLSVDVIKNTLTQNSLDRKGFIWFRLPDNSPSLREIRAGTQARNLKQKPWRNLRLTHSVIHVYTDVLYNPGPPAQKMLMLRVHHSPFLHQLKQHNSSGTCSQSNLIETIAQLRLFFIWVQSSCQLMLTMTIWDKKLGGNVL